MVLHSQHRLKIIRQVLTQMRSTNFQPLVLFAGNNQLSVLLAWLVIRMQQSWQLRILLLSWSHLLITCVVWAKKLKMK